MAKQAVIPPGSLQSLGQCSAPTVAALGKSAALLQLLGVPDICAYHVLQCHLATYDGPVVWTPAQPHSSPCPLLHNCTAAQPPGG